MPRIPSRWAVARHCLFVYADGKGVFTKVSERAVLKRHGRRDDKDTSSGGIFSRDVDGVQTPPSSLSHLQWDPCRLYPNLTLSHPHPTAPKTTLPAPLPLPSPAHWRELRAASSIASSCIIDRVVQTPDTTSTHCSSFHLSGHPHPLQSAII